MIKLILAKSQQKQTADSTNRICNICFLLEIFKKSNFFLCLELLYIVYSCKNSKQKEERIASEVEGDRDKICSSKIISIANIMDHGKMTVLWTRETAWKIGKLIVYRPRLEACDG